MGPSAATPIARGARSPRCKHANALCLALALLCASPAHAQWAGVKLELDWTSVGSPGNPCDPQPMGCFGSVLQPFQIARYETTNEQYARFLNAVGATDSYALYNLAMATDPNQGGITRSGLSGSYTYEAKPGFEDKPVSYVSFWDALRFANWLYNGQPVGGQFDSTTESGAYTLTPGGVLLNLVPRTPDAGIFLPNENEWFKAAYHGGGATWFDYPAGSDAVTTCAAPDDFANRANCAAAVGAVSTVGAYVDSPSPSGSFDQGGNLVEWNEGRPSALTRRTAGGWWGNVVSSLAASNRDADLPANEGPWSGFRVARLGPPVALELALDPNQTEGPYTWSLTLDINAGYDVEALYLFISGCSTFAINPANPNIGDDPLTMLQPDPLGDGRDLLILASTGPGVPVVIGPATDSLLGTFECETGTTLPVLAEGCPFELCGATVALTDDQPIPPADWSVQTLGPPPPDTDGDGVVDPLDNCPTIANPSQADGAGGLEVPPDGVGDVCDNCVEVSNPRPVPRYLDLNPWATLTGGQRDDDFDGYGNKCDAKFVGPPSQVVGGLDLGQFRNSNAKDRRTDTCGTSELVPCAIFDLDEAAVGNSIGGLDFGRFRALATRLPGPRCAACPLACEAGAAGSCGE